ncbi:MAG: class I tRNA ligase family protein [Candidatus Wolfebacteria bacterium]|nr:class I tRNA ligase family protein [Candidatus Wolfebacteria bacterium]
MFGDFKTSKISEIEQKILKYWQDNKIFEKSVNKPAGKNPKKDYVFYDGPPFATGLPHYGHIIASAIKDVIPRYRTMNGFRVERRWGWDCHGLPIENIVEQKLNLKTKKDIEKYGVENFNEEARKEVLKYVDDWKEIIPRMGRWVDMEHDYKTMDTSYTESVWWIFKTLFGKKLIYEGYKSMQICPRCETTLSNFEVAQGYKYIEDSSVYVKFESVDEPGTYFLAWTTTPWTLPGNVALAVNPKIEYVTIRIKNKELRSKTGEKYILARERLVVIDGDYDILEIIKGEKLIGKKYKSLFDYYTRDKKIENREQGWKIYAGDFVSTDEGTGIVHIAPAFGADDMALGKKNNLPFIQHVGMDGRFKPEVSDFSGLQVKPKGNPQETDLKIIDLLTRQGKLLRVEKIKHSYPHCWRCDTPLLNYAANSWFLDIAAIKKGKGGLLENNKKVNWVPEHVKKGRFGKILEDAPDWAISRTRYWGAPLPVWKCEKCGKRKIVGSIKDIKENSINSGNKYFVMRHGESENNVAEISAATLKAAAKYHLTEKGKKEARASAQKLLKELKGKKPDVIFSSELARAKETAELVAKEVGLRESDVIFDKRLMEVDVGIFDGKYYRDYDNYFSSLLEKFTKNPPEGENLIKLKNRVTEFLYDIDKKYKDKNILIVSHEYPLWLMIAGAEGAGVEKSIEMRGTKDDFIKRGELKSLDFSPLPHNKNYELDLHRPYIDEVEFACEKCHGKMKRENYVFDCWFESGAMPYGQAHYPFENKKKFEKNFPAEFIAEGIDQTRGWFYTMLVLATSLFKKPAYKNVVVNGIILAENGQKMSKRLKNYPDPMEVVNKYGADALRYYLLSSPVVRAEDLNFSEKGVDEIYKKLILRLANVVSFYEMYASDQRPTTNNQRPKTNNVLDTWIIARLEQLANEAGKAMDNYELDKAVRPLSDFVDDISTWYVRRSRDRFKSAGKDKAEAVVATRYVLEKFSKVMAPFMPFMAEWLNFKLGNKESVHLSGWPKFKEIRGKNREVRLLLEQMKDVRRLASLGLEAREKAGMRVRQPLASLRIKNKELRIKNKEELLEILRDEINVKEIIFDSKISGEVELDTNITPELKEEGILRDFVRLVQGLRQEAGYTPKDKISLWFEMFKELEWPISNNLKIFKDRVGAERVEFSKTDKFDAETETNVDGKKVWAGIKKVK